MKTAAWIFFFFLILITDLIAVYVGNDLLKTIFKPLVVITLIAYFISQTSSQASTLKRWVIIALIFSLVGDILLLPESKNSTFFLSGLVSFLIAHIFYIIFFHEIRVRENIKSRVLLLLVVVIYYAGIISFLSPHLGPMKIPVRIYAVFISFMFMLALHASFISNTKAGLLLVSGAFLFVISDSLLAINKFYSAFSFASIAIMLTYGVAQFLIVTGAMQYINKAK